MTAFEHLLQPIRIGNLELKNRLLMTPMGTELCTHDGRSTPAEAAYYGERAKGGTGLVRQGHSGHVGSRAAPTSTPPASKRSRTPSTPVAAGSHFS